jgi:hypothetical protein
VKVAIAEVLDVPSFSISMSPTTSAFMEYKAAYNFSL